uniref:BTB domain-containing protein n=2 Tax=Anopheles albimanus TaxID=7167 RepID=A0A182F460_ANOAL
MKEPFEIMTDQEHYSLRWNNHQNHILRAFDTLLQTKTLVDVTLVCAETSIRAHKVVLSACSPFFQRVFSETPCKHPVIVLKDFRGWVVQAIVDFMYRGEISVPQERLSVLIQAGESLQVRGLVDHPVAGNTPTPAQSPEDFSLLESSLISPTSPSLPSPNFPHANHHQQLPTVSSSNLRHHVATGGSTSTPKMLLPPQVFADPTISLPGAELCTSPMPRRKQARPRRRSGDCAPQDLSSKPTTPEVPHSLDDDEQQEGKQEEHEDRAEDIGDADEDMEGLEEEDEDDDDALEEEDADEEDDLKRMLCRSQSVDEKLAAIGASKEGGLRAQSRAGSATSEERRSRALHKPQQAASGSRKTSGSCKAAGDRSLSKGDDALQQTMPSLTPSSSGSSVSDGPENLCMKKPSPSRPSGSLINNQQHPAEGLANSDRDRHSPVGARSSSRDGSTRLGASDTLMKGDTAPLTDPSGIGRGLLSLKDIRHLNRAALNRSLGSLSPPPSFASSLNNNLHPALGLLGHHHLHHHHHHATNDAKRVKMEHHRDEDRAGLLAHLDDMEPPHFLDHMDLALGTHQHPLATHPHTLSTHAHHLRGSSPQLHRPPPGEGPMGPESNNNNNNNGGNNGKKNSGSGS